MSMHYEMADIVVMDNRGIYRVVKSRFGDVPVGRFITSKELAYNLNSKRTVAVCDTKRSVYEKNF